MGCQLPISTLLPISISIPVLKCICCKLCIFDLGTYKRHPGHYQTTLTRWPEFPSQLGKGVN